MIVSAVVISAAIQVQQISCFPTEASSADRVVISLQLPDRPVELPVQGTLFLSSGLDDVGNQDSIGPLPLKLVPESDDDAQKGLVRYQSSGDLSTFEVSIHQDDLGRTQKNFPLDLELMRLSDKYRTTEKLNCYSTVFVPSSRTVSFSGKTNER
jgi:hypothetical protein